MSEKSVSGRLPFGGKRRLFEVIWVRLGRWGRRVEVDTGGRLLESGVAVVVRVKKVLILGETEGCRFRRVVAPNTLASMVRLASAQDLETDAENRLIEEKAVRTASALAFSDGPEMKIIAAELSLDRRRVTIAFSAEERVDFRRMVRELGQRLGLSIEMLQLGPRHGAGILGGMGSCGQVMCCARFLTDFEPVAIKMVKAQGLALNPKRVSGMCGRLMCCLAYEYSGYLGGRKEMPKRNRRCLTRLGVAKVTEVDVLKRGVDVVHMDGTRATLALDDVVLDPDPATLPDAFPLEPVRLQLDGASTEAKASRSGQHRATVHRERHGGGGEGGGERGHGRGERGALRPRPASGGERGAAGSRPASGGERGAAGSRPASGGERNAAGPRPASGGERGVAAAEAPREAGGDRKRSRRRRSGGKRGAEGGGGVLGESAVAGGQRSESAGSESAEGRVAGRPGSADDGASPARRRRPRRRGGGNKGRPEGEPPREGGE